MNDKEATRQTASVEARPWLMGELFYSLFLAKGGRLLSFARLGHYSLHGIHANQSLRIADMFER